MVKGIETFYKYFKDYENQYVLIGGSACDIIFSYHETNFRATRDLDVVLIVEALTPEFGEKFWEFIKDGKYRNKMTSNGKMQFYRFDKPEDSRFPKMIELFSKTPYMLEKTIGVTPIYIDESISSLSAILLDKDYYLILREGREIINGISVLKAEYLILFKAKAYLDLMRRKYLKEAVDSRDIKKHKKDILRICVEIQLTKVRNLPISIKKDIHEFIHSIEEDPFDETSLKFYNLNNQEIVDLLKKIYE